MYSESLQMLKSDAAVIVEDDGTLTGDVQVPDVRTQKLNIVQCSVFSH